MGFDSNRQEKKVIALLLSGGIGSRMKTERPKQYIEICGKPIIAYCMEALAVHTGIDWIQIVADELWHDEIRKYMCKQEKFIGFSIPGKTRQLSILNGLRDISSLAKDMDLVLIHDAARPMLSEKQITDCLATSAGHDGVMPALPMKDTVYCSDGKTITNLLDRERIFAGQAPEVFCFGAYYKANLQLSPDKIVSIKGSTEPAILAGMDIAIIPGDENNFKITTKEDLKRFESICTI